MFSCSPRSPRSPFRAINPSPDGYFFSSRSFLHVFMFTTFTTFTLSGDKPVAGRIFFFFQEFFTCFHVHHVHHVHPFGR